MSDFKCEGCGVAMPKDEACDKCVAEFDKAAKELALETWNEWPQMVPADRTVCEIEMNTEALSPDGPVFFVKADGFYEMPGFFVGIIGETKLPGAWWTAVAKWRYFTG